MHEFSWMKIWRRKGKGAMVNGKEKIEPEHLAHGIEIARENARLDVGQGVVVSRGTVLYLELQRLYSRRSIRRYQCHEIILNFK